MPWKHRPGGRPGLVVMLGLRSFLGCLSLDRSLSASPGKMEAYPKLVPYSLRACSSWCQ